MRLRWLERRVAVGPHEKRDAKEMKPAGYVVFFLFLGFLAYTQYGWNGLLLASAVGLIGGAFFVLQTKSLAPFYLEVAPTLARLLK